MPRPAPSSPTSFRARDPVAATIDSLPMPNPVHWEVRSTGGETTVVEAPNWLVAFGAAMQVMGRGQDCLRMACEVQSSGTAVINDLASRRRYVIKRVSGVVEPRRAS